MKSADLVRTAWSNLGRRKLRFCLAALGVLVGTVTIVLMVSLGSGVRRQINQQFTSVGLDRFSVFPTGKSPSGGRSPFEGRPPFVPDSPSQGGRSIISPADVARWKEWAGVAEITPQITLHDSAEIELRWQDKSQRVRMSSIQPRPGPGFTVPSPEARAGTLELAPRGGIVLSLGAAKGLGLVSGELTGLLGQSVDAVLRAPRGETQSFALRIQGISSESGATIRVSVEDCVAMKSWWFNKERLLESEGYDAVNLRGTDASHARALINRIRQEGFQIQSLDIFVEIANRIVMVITIALSLIGGVALLVASIGIANTMVMSVYERTREIGILKALGASSGDIRRLFMLEAAFIGLAGGVVGLLAGWALGAVLNRGIGWYLAYREMPARDSFFVVTPELAVGVTVFAVVIGVLAGLLPAQKAAALDPIDALRYE